MSNDLDMDFIKSLLAKRDEGTGFKSSDKDQAGLRFFNMPGEAKHEVTLRFLPPWKGSKTPGKIVKTHWQIPGDTKKIHCYSTYGLECPMCKYLKEIESVTDITEWIPSERANMNVLVIEDSRTKNFKSDEPYILGTSPGILYWLFEQMIDAKVGNITDPTNGHNVTIKRKQDNGAFNKTIWLKPNPIAATPDKVQAILDSMYNLDNIWRKPDDQYHAFMVECIAKVKGVVENRLLKEAAKGQTQSNQSANHATPAASPAPAGRWADSPPTAKPATTRPPNSPECFADKGVFVAEELRINGVGKRCDICPMEFNCSEEIRRQG